MINVKGHLWGVEVKYDISSLFFTFIFLVFEFVVHGPVSIRAAGICCPRTSQYSCCRNSFCLQKNTSFLM